MKSNPSPATKAMAGLSAALLAASTLASSHREAPQITFTPKVDCSDFYLFNSYEAGRENFVTVVANYLPLQDAYGGPNYFSLDPNAVYEIHIDNNGDAVEDLTFQFRFANKRRDLTLAIGPAGQQKTLAVPVPALGQISAGKTEALNLEETYTINLIRGPRRVGAPEPIRNADGGALIFSKPADNIGNKTFPNYPAYADAHIYNINIPGCATPGKVFVGQRKDSFVVNLGETFDLVNITGSPFTAPDSNPDSLAYKNVTSIILELPRECLLRDANQPVVGAWTTASQVVMNGGAAEMRQLSRLGMPLVNEVVIGVKDKDKFNSSEPKNDLADFADYVTHPTLPAIIEILFGSAGVKAPTAFPRADLVSVFVTGIEGLNKTSGAGELLRLNTAIPAVPAAKQNSLGVIAGVTAGVLDAAKADLAGFPNGRRPGDDVVDIALRVVMGKLLAPNVAPSGDLPFTDGAAINAFHFQDGFPYLRAPVAGSPVEPFVTVTLQSAATVSGPYSDVPATYDAAKREFVAPKPAGGAGFYRAKSDRKINLGGVSLEQDKARIGLK